jgi:hypothetical protein
MLRRAKPAAPSNAGLTLVVYEGAGACCVELSTRRRMLRRAKHTYTHADVC